MADATLQILGLGSKAVPLDYNVTGNQDLDLIAVKADFDGTGAGVDFVPVIQILSDADHVMAQAKGATVTAGASATVTFAPFLEDAGGGGGTDPNAVHYGVLGETGSFIDSTTTTGGITFEDHSGVGLTIESEDGTGNNGFISITTASGETFINSESIVNRLHPAGSSFEIQDHSSNQIVRVDENHFVVFRLASAQEFQILGPFSALIAKFIDGGGGDNSYQMALPAVNPGGTNLLWNNAGVVNIT